MTLFQQISTEANFNNAWIKVRSNLGAPGIDRVSVEEFEKNLNENLDYMRKILQDGSYEVLPYKAFTHPKASGKIRTLHIVSVRDRIVQQALLSVLQPIYEKIFHNCSYAYRPGKSALKAVDRVERNFNRGRKWLLCADIENFFDEIDRQILITTFAQTIREKEVVKLTEQFINALENPDDKGIAQGMVIAPLLSNIYLHSFDDKMFRFTWQYIRYSDNILVQDHEENQIKMAHQTAIDQLQELKLKLNEQKTRLCHLTQGFTFLGYHFDERGKRPADAAIGRMEQRVGKILNKATEYSRSQLKEKLESIVRGWLNYFQISGSDKRELLQQIEQKFSDQADSMPQRILRSALAYQLGDHARAQSTLKTAPITSTEDADINLQWGMLCDLLDMKTEALDSFLAAYRFKSEHPDAAFRIGLHYLENFQYELAMRYLQKAVQLNPQNPAVHLALGTAMQKFAMNGAAQGSFKKAIQLDAGVKKYISKSQSSTTPQAKKVPFATTDQDIPYVIRLFSGREGVFARQWISQDGKIGYTPVFQPITERDIKAHLNTEQTLAYYIMRSDNTVNQVVFDIDITKQVRTEVITRDSDIENWKDYVWSEVSKLKLVLQQLRVESYIEDSGFKGMHLWIFFAEPQPARDAILFAKKILTLVGSPAPGLAREIFPRESRVAPKALGSMVKLPLGIHKLTGKRCSFLDNTGKPFADQLAVVRNIIALPSNSFRAVLEKLKSPAPLQAEPQPKADRSQVDKVLKGCNVLRYLAEKAEKEKHLTHVDRLTILSIFNHLNKAGQQTIHEIISHTLNYNFRITEKWIQRKRGFPVSCPKIREWQSHITPSVGCYCKFKEFPNSYPSPVLHVDPEFIIKVKTKQQPSVQSKAVSSRQDQISNQKKAEVIMDSTAASNAPDPIESTEKIEHKPVAIANIDNLFQNYVKHKKDQRELVQKIAEIETQLNQLCQQQKTEQFVTEFGVFKRVKEGDRFKWMIEI